MKLHPRILITFYLFVRYIVLKYKSRKTLKPSPGRNGPHLLEVQQGHNPKKILVQYIFFNFEVIKWKCRRHPWKLREKCVSSFKRPARWPSWQHWQGLHRCTHQPQRSLPTCKSRISLFFCTKALWYCHNFILIS